MHVKMWSLKWRSEEGGMNIKFKLIVSYHQVKLDAGHTEYLWKPQCVCVMHTLSIAVRHFPPNSARTGYVTEGALFITMQLSTNVVSTLWKVWILVRLWWLHITQAQRKHEMHPPQVQSKFCLDWNNFCFICGGVRKLSVFFIQIKICSSRWKTDFSYRCQYSASIHQKCCTWEKKKSLVENSGRCLQQDAWPTRMCEKN